MDPGRSGLVSGSGLNDSVGLAGSGSAGSDSADFPFSGAAGALEKSERHCGDILSRASVSRMSIFQVTRESKYPCRVPVLWGG